LFAVTGEMPEGGLTQAQADGVTAFVTNVGLQMAIPVLAPIITGIAYAPFDFGRIVFAPDCSSSVYVEDVENPANSGIYFNDCQGDDGLPTYAECPEGDGYAVCSFAGDCTRATPNTPGAWATFGTDVSSPEGRCVNDTTCIYGIPASADAPFQYAVDELIGSDLEFESLEVKVAASEMAYMERDHFVELWDTLPGVENAKKLSMGLFETFEDDPVVAKYTASLEDQDFVSIGRMLENDRTYLSDLIQGIFDEAFPAGLDLIDTEYWRLVYDMLRSVWHSVDLVRLAADDGEIDPIFNLQALLTSILSTQVVGDKSVVWKPRSEALPRGDFQLADGRSMKEVFPDFVQRFAPTVRELSDATLSLGPALSATVPKFLAVFGTLFAEEDDDDEEGGTFQCPEPEGEGEEEDLGGGESESRKKHPSLKSKFLSKTLSKAIKMLPKRA
jgi:hypothetical protein